MISLLALLATITPSPAIAGYSVDVTAPTGWSDGIDTVVVVVGECDDAINCGEVAKEARVALRRTFEDWSIPSASLVRQELMALGAFEYSAALREQMATALEADAVIEIAVRHSAKGAVGWRGSEATVTLVVRSPTGEILMMGEGAGRARNTISSPESVAGETVERIARKAGDRR